MSEASVESEKINFTKSMKKEVDPRETHLSLLTGSYPPTEAGRWALSSSVGWKKQ